MCTQLNTYMYIYMYICHISLSLSRSFHRHLQFEICAVYIYTHADDIYVYKYRHTDSVLMCLMLFVIWACSIPNNFYKTRLRLASSIDSCGLASFLGAGAVSSSLPLNLNTDAGVAIQPATNSGLIASNNWQ